VKAVQTRLFRVVKPMRCLILATLATKSASCRGVVSAMKGVGPHAATRGMSTWMRADS
jgi:hypothetical protein